MMISQPALLCLNATWQRLTGRFAYDEEPVEPEVLAQALTGDSAVLATATSERRPEGPVMTDAAHPVPATPERDQIAADEPAEGGPLSANERRARAAALRGLALSRGRSFDAAGVAFAEAARLDPLLDLTRTPAFWKLERAAHEAAIDAYVQAGRERDAAVLRARVQSTFRPRPLRSRQHVTLSP